MAKANRVVTRQRKGGKLVVRYRVVWREPLRESFGVQQKGRYRNRSKVYAEYAEATARADELSAAAVRGIRVHDLRHTAAVLYLGAGVHFMRVSQILGYATYTVTLDAYGDWIEQDNTARCRCLHRRSRRARRRRSCGNRSRPRTALRRRGNTPARCLRARAAISPVPMGGRVIR